MAISIRDPIQTEEHPGLEAGVIEGVKDLVTVAPRLLELQLALSSGIASTQEREARRLAAKYGDDHPRVAAAQARAAALTLQGRHIDTGVGHIGKALEPLTTQNLFSGYVVDSAGDPAEGHVVQLKLRGEKGAELNGKADKDGYFRIPLGGAKVAGRDPVKSLAANLARFMPTTTVPAEAAAKSTKSDKAAAATINTDPKQVREYDVSILDSAGKVVHEEELPLRVNAGQSTFRYYVLPDKATPPPSKPEPKVRRAAKAK